MLRTTNASLAVVLAGGNPNRASEIDPAIVEHFAEMRALLVDADNRLGGFSVLPTAIQQTEIIASYRRAASGSLRTKLLGAQARWAEFAGWLCDDLGKSSSGTWWIGQASDIAEEADDRELTAYILARRAQRLTQTQDRDRVLGLGTAAAKIKSPPHVTAFAYVQQAHGYAIAGNEKAFQAKIYDAVQIVDNSAAQKNQLGSFCTLTYLQGQEGEGWLHLNQPAKAADCFTKAVSGLPLTYRREHALYLAKAAEAKLAADEPDEAAHIAGEALQLAVITRSTRTQRNIEALAERFSLHSDHQSVRLLLEALTDAKAKT